MMIVHNPVLLLLCFTFISSAVAKDPWWQIVAKKQGPMVCAEEFVEESNRYFAAPWTGGSLCGSEAIIRFTCCYGYGRVQGEGGCPLVKPLENLAETAREAGANKFIDQAEQSGLLPLLSDRGAYTVFVAKDIAFESLTKEQEKSLNASKRSRSRPPVLLYTIAEGRITTEDFADSLTTLYREGSVVITKFPNGLTTVNCVPLIATNIEATNGIIHITESLLLPTGRNTVTDLLAKTPSLGTTAAALVRAQLANELRDKRPLTVFAPSDQAWEALPPTFMEAVMEDPSSLKVLLQHHIVEAVWCSAVSSGATKMLTLEGSFIEISCNGSGKYVNDAQIIESDSRAGNGFVHHIDKVLIPDRVLSLTECLEDRNIKYFLKLAEASGLLPILKRQDAYTLFVPEDDAFEALPNETLSDLFDNTAFARSVISFHITPGRHLTVNLIDGQKFPTLKGPEPQLRLKMHKKRVSVESAFIKEMDLKARNGIVQIIDRVLFPPTKSILEKLQEGNYSIFLGFLNQTEPNLLKLLDNSSSTFTVLAPSDLAMNDTPPGMIPRLLADPLMLYKAMAQHILRSFVVSKSLEPRLTYLFTTISNTSVTVRKETDDFVTVARLAEVTVPDVISTNGVIHEISRLIHF